jgi:ADP-heptose:LPS heptosyltransferase
MIGSKNRLQCRSGQRSYLGFCSNGVTNDEKRECPLKHHDCMKKIEAEEVIEAIDAL